MIGIGLLHFVADDLFAQIVPPFFPARYALVWISGIIEVALGIGILFARTRRRAGFGLVALYIAVFPANIYMAVSDLHIHGLPAGMDQPPAIALWLRLPFQIVFILWGLWVAEIWPRRKGNA
ncbi:MAG TPA: hypothetical protein VK524_20545 [Polyangiaceae bacterium]|nr:hypothetical protein [Polyangiaceae bacterium]